MNKSITIALVGQPNVGKSSLINSISNSKLKVGNFSGVTIEKSEVEFKYKNINFKIIDLPGTYSIDGYSMEEKIVKKFLLDKEYDLILNVADSTNLDRNLFLTRELMEMGNKMVLALNMSDEAQNEGIVINQEYLESLLGIKSIKVSAKKRSGIELLLDTIIYVNNKEFVKPKIVYSDVVEEEIGLVQEFIKKSTCDCKKYDSRDIAIALLRRDKYIYKLFHEKPFIHEVQPLLQSSLQRLYTYFNTDVIQEIIMDEVHSFAHGAYHESVQNVAKKKRGISHIIDDVLIHPIFGIPIFLLLMWSLFQLTFELGSIPMEYIDIFFNSLSRGVEPYISNETFKDLLSEGIIPGVGAVVLFLPNIVILFLGISLLETTGYMARVAFLLDGFFHRFGLHGKSFIPLVTGFGCSVPAYMATRTLKSRKDRLITLFIIGFMSCGAKLPVYVLFVGAFFDSNNAGNMLFAIYILGAIIGLMMAKVLRMTAFKSEDEPFVMEMPKYRVPSLYVIWFTVYHKALMYLKKAGTFILAASIIIWFASNYPKLEIPKNLDTNSVKLYELEHSYLGIIGKFTQPFFEPLGFDWRLTVSLEAGLAAKEVAVATLGILYNIGENIDEKSSSLLSAIRGEIPFEVAVSFIIFIMLYMPCMAASVVFAKEAGGYKYTLYLFIFTTTVAWIFAFIGYNIARL